VQCQLINRHFKYYVHILYLCVAVGLLLVSCIQAEIYDVQMYFRLVAAIFDLRLTQVSQCIQTISIVFLDLNPMSMHSRWNSVISCVEAEILRKSHIYFRFLSTILLTGWNKVYSRSFTWMLNCSEIRPVSWPGH